MMTRDYQNSDKEYFMVAALIRGTIMNSMTFLERTIDVFISTHFAGKGDKSKELMNVVFATKYVTFESKRAIFKYILDTHHSVYKDKNLKDLHARLGYFNDVRNEMAHYVIDANEYALNNFKSNNNITFLRFLKGIDFVIYDEVKAAEISNEILSYVEPIAKMLDIDNQHSAPTL